MIVQPLFQEQEILAPIDVAIHKMIGASLRATDDFVKIRKAVRINGQATNDRPGQRAANESGPLPTLDEYGIGYLAHPYEYKREYWQHITQMVIKPGLRTDQYQDRPHRREKQELVAPGTKRMASAKGQYRR